MPRNGNGTSTMICSFSWEINVPIWYIIYPPVSSNMAGKSTIYHLHPGSARQKENRQSTLVHVCSSMLRQKTWLENPVKCGKPHAINHHPFGDGKNVVMTWGWCEMATKRNLMVRKSMEIPVNWDYDPRHTR